MEIPPKDLHAKIYDDVQQYGREMLAEILRRHKDPSNGYNGKAQYTTGKTSGTLRIEPTARGFQLVGWQYAGTYEEGRQPNAKAWGTSGNDSTEWSDSLVAWAKAKGLAFKSESDARGWAFCVMRKMAREGSRRYRIPSERKDIFQTPIAEMQQKLTDALEVFFTDAIKQTITRIDLQ